MSQNIEDKAIVNSFGQIMNFFRRWKLRRSGIDQSSTEKREAKIYISQIQFSGGQTINLNDNSILVIVGPNNAGKSSTLREIRNYLEDGHRYGPVIQSLAIGISGSPETFKTQIREAGLATQHSDVIAIGYNHYALDSVDDEHPRSFVRSKVIPLFVSYLGAEERLKIADPIDRGDYIAGAPKNVMQWLELDEQVEQRISKIFEKTFNVGLILNTLAGSKLYLHTVPPDQKQKECSNTRDAAAWLASLPRLNRQGDGMRSFAGTILSLLVHPTSAILLDEPEAFLHPPQARQLARVVADEVPGGCQIIVATHNDAFVRALLDISGDRLQLARIVREGSRNVVTTLDQSQLDTLWKDPLIRTSDVLSALFHEAAILCEGDSDARFYGMLLEETAEDNYDLDARIYHFGGKDRIASIAAALLSVKIPVVAIVDIDILSDVKKFQNLFEIMGGDFSSIEKDVRDIVRTTNERKGQLTGKELSIELTRLADEVGRATEVLKENRERLLDLGKIGSNWQRIKQDGFRALDVPAFERIFAAAKAVGLLINREGELEGFCRTISKTSKSNWLANAIQKDFRNEAALSDARSFADIIRETVRLRAKSSGRPPSD